MKKTNLKTVLVACVAAFALIGTVAYREFAPSSFAAEEHAHGHEHAEDEASHDKGKEEHGHAHGDDGHGSEDGHEEGVVSLNAEQQAATGIEVAPAGSGALTREVTVPGKIVVAADRMAQIVPKVSGTVTEARKNLGDSVEKGEVLALVESREMAEAVADYLAAKRTEELARTIFNREKGLWDKKITAEQDYLGAKSAYQSAQIRLDLTHQKLQALGHAGETGYDANARFHELKAPLAGRVIARALSLGEYVDTTRSAYTVSDLSVVWVETAIAPGDIPFVKEGQTATVAGSGGKAQGKLIFVSPAINPETRAAKAIIALENADGAWRPGAFVNAAIATSAQEIAVMVPKEALQIIENQKVVFVRTDKGFEKRVVSTGREDSRHVEIISGIASGEPVAVTNTFTLKAELGKSEAGHEH